MTTPPTQHGDATRTAGLRALESSLRPHRDRRVLATLIFVVAATLWVTQPRLVYRGDPLVVRVAAAHWLETGELGIPFAHRAALGDLVTERGQYFYENDTEQRFYSKFGVANTVLFMPPLIAEMLWSGGLAILEPDAEWRHWLIDYTPSLKFFLNAYNLLWAVVIALYLFGLARFFAGAPVSAAFVLCVVFTTFLWNYLRAQSSEILQVALFVGCVFHLFAFRRSLPAASRTRNRKVWLHVAAATICAGTLLLTKLYYVILLPWVWIYVAAATVRGDRNAGATGETTDWVERLRAHVKPLAFALVLPTLVLGTAAILAARQKFGAPWMTGYEQWRVNGDVVARLSLSGLPRALCGFLFDGDRSVFTHFPPLAVAAIGWRLFWQQARPDARFIASTSVLFLIAISAFDNWKGEWCYGPRYLLFALPAAAIPFVYVLSWLAEHRRTLVGGALGFGLLAVLCLSLKLQLAVNGLPFFARDAIYASTFKKIDCEPATAYFEKRHFGLVHADLMAFRSGERPFPPITAYVRTNTPSSDEIRRLEAFIRRLLVRNYHFSTEARAARAAARGPTNP